MYMDMLAALVGAAIALTGFIFGAACASMGSRKKDDK